VASNVNLGFAVCEGYGVSSAGVIELERDWIFFCVCCKRGAFWLSSIASRCASE